MRGFYGPGASNETIACLRPRRERTGDRGEHQARGSSAGKADDLFCINVTLSCLCFVFVVQARIGALRQLQCRR